MASPQVNARLTPELDAEFDRWATELGVERGKLGKDIITEALGARREGRAIFEKPVTLGPGDMIAMQATLERGVMEIDRIATVWAKHEADVRKQERDNQQMRTQVQGEIIADLPARKSKSLNPIRQEMLTMAERIDKQPRLDAIDERQRVHTAALKANTVAIEQLERQPRRVTGIVFDRDQDWTIVIIAVWSLLMIGLAIFPLTAVEMAFPGIAIPLANRLMSGDADFCRLVHYRFESEGCQVPRAHQIMIVSNKTAATPKAISDGTPKATTNVPPRTKHHPSAHPR